MFCATNAAVLSLTNLLRTYNCAIVYINQQKEVIGKAEERKSELRQILKNKKDERQKLVNKKNITDSDAHKRAMKAVKRTAKKGDKDKVQKLSEALDTCNEKHEQATAAKLKMYKELMKRKGKAGASPTKLQDEVLDDPSYRVLVKSEADALVQLQAAKKKLTGFSMSVMLLLSFCFSTWVVAILSYSLAGVFVVHVKLIRCYSFAFRF